MPDDRARIKELIRRTLHLYPITSASMLSVHIRAGTADYKDVIREMLESGEIECAILRQIGEVRTSVGYYLKGNPSALEHLQRIHAQHVSPLQPQSRERERELTAALA